MTMKVGTCSFQRSARRDRAGCRRYHVQRLRNRGVEFHHHPEYNHHHYVQVAELVATSAMTTNSSNRDEMKH